MKDRLKIGFDNEAKTTYESLRAIKIKIARDMLKYCKEYITIENEGEFLRDALNSFKSQWLTQYKDAYADMNVIQEKQYELVGFSMNKLQAFISYFNGIDVDILSKDTPDFNQYLIGADKIKLYKERLKFVKALNEYLDTGADYFPMKFQQTFKGAFYYDYKTHKITPNLQ